MILGVIGMILVVIGYLFNIYNERAFLTINIIGTILLIIDSLNFIFTPIVIANILILFLLIIKFIKVVFYEKRKK